MAGFQWIDLPCRRRRGFPTDLRVFIGSVRAAVYLSRVPLETSYRVELDQFSGPMDLLLHLLSEEELDVERIEVARICDRYLEHLTVLDRIDIDAAGDFLVMAATLMRLKSRSLLPREEAVLEDEDLDPRFELIRQLIEYRRFKQAAEALEVRRAEAAQRTARGMHPEAGAAHAPPAAPDVAGVTVETLFAAFARLLRETAAAGYVVTKDDTPMEVHLTRLRQILEPGARLRFQDLFPGSKSRGYVIGVFLALLELMKQQELEVFQPEEFGEIFVERRAAPQEPAGTA